MEAIKQFEALIAAKISVIKNLWSLICLEARLAGMSVFPLLLNIIMLFVVLITVWLATMSLIGYFIFIVSNSTLLSMGLVLLFNVVLMLSLLKYLSFNLKNMSFQKTRDYFSNSKSKEYEKLEKATYGSNCTNGQKVAMPEKQGE